LRLDKRIEKHPELLFTKMILLIVGSSIFDLRFQKERVVLKGKLYIIKEVLLIEGLCCI
jgi:hypothetical protein